MENEIVIPALGLGLLALAVVFSAIALKMIADVRREMRELKQAADIKPRCKHDNVMSDKSGFKMCLDCHMVLESSLKSPA